MFCHECGVKLTDGERVCHVCGTPVPAGSVSQEIPPTPPRRRRLRIVVLALAALVVLGAIVVLARSYFADAPYGSGDASHNSSAAASHQASAAVDKGSWTVLAYICGSNLESQGGYATSNIAELLSVELPANVSFVLETGGADAWHNNTVDASRLQRYLVQDGTMQLEDELPRVSMSDAETLSSFVGWGVQAHPAEHYMLVFWDHGGGSLAGVCQDELDYGALTLPEIAEALSQTTAHFDVVGFDTCLMATLETAQILAPYADYLVASQEVEPSGGWDWSGWPAWFAQGADASPTDLGRCICDSFMDKCAKAGVEATSTLSVVDLARIDEVGQAFAGAAEGMARATEQPARLQRLVQDGRDVQAFGNANYIDGYTNMVDLADLMACMADDLDVEQEVLDAVSQAVVYERHGNRKARATGLSVFYPLAIDADTFLAYFALSTQNGLDNVPYLQYLATRTGTYGIVDWAGLGVEGLDPVGEEDARGAFLVSSSIDGNGRYVVEVDGNTEWIAGATCMVGQQLDDGTLVWLGSDNDLDLSIDEQTGAVWFADRFDGGWYTIGDCFVRADIVDAVAEGGKASYALYSTPVEWTTTLDGEQYTLACNLLSFYDYESGAYAVLCVYADADESGMAGKSVAALSEGDTLRFLVDREVDGRRQEGSTGTLTVTDDLAMGRAFAGNTGYVYAVTVVDIFGNGYMPDPALITYTAGERSAHTFSLD